MDFEHYITLISDSAASTGYDGFLPSICVVSDKIEMNVLQTGLSATGDEDIAKEWASEFIRDDSIIYLAYRSGDRTVTVIEINGTDVTQKVGLKIRPHSG